MPLYAGQQENLGYKDLDKGVKRTKQMELFKEMALAASLYGRWWIIQMYTMLWLICKITKMCYACYIFLKAEKQHKWKF